MRQVVLDFESFYSKDYTLRKMTPVEYILDPRFELTGCAIKEDGADSYFLSGDEFTKWLPQAKLHDAIVISHNALFDMCILAWRHSVTPKLMIDTLGMARATVYHLTGSVSLESVARVLALPPKGTTIQSVIGMNGVAIRQAGLWEAYAEYAKHDADLCWEVYQRLRKDFPIPELLVMDAVLRCAITPKFLLDRDVLAHHRAHVVQQKAEVMAKAMLVGLNEKAELMSNDKFAELLKSVGCEPPTKTSKVTGKVTWAFAKTDQGMIDLEDHPNPAVQALVAARLGNKTTLEETRTERLLTISHLHWPKGVGNLPYTSGYMPIPLRYSGAHTHRLSGEWRINCMHPDVELLTPAGWQRVQDWQPHTPIMQWWPDGRLDWEINPAKVERQETELVWFDSPFVKGGFSRDHRMVALRGARIVERTAGWIADHSGLDNIPVSGRYSGGNSLLTPDQVRLLVALAADGSVLYASGPRILNQPRPSIPSGGWQWGFNKQRKADRLRHLLAACGVISNEWTDGSRTNFTVRESRCPPWLKKGFGSWVLNLTADCMDALLDELVHWDGFSNSRSGQPTFCTTLRAEALWVQTIAHMRDRPCTVKRYVKTTNSGAVYLWHVYSRRGKLTSVDHTITKPYDGYVYCPSVSSSYVIARYGEGVFITGQCQNLPRGGNLRKALKAPHGYEVITVDSSQIEARIVACISGQDDLVEAFAQGRDVYSEFASELYGRPITRADKVERFIGKGAILGLGFGMGGPRFYDQAVSGSHVQGITLGADFTPDFADRAVVFYRKVKYPRIEAAWSALKASIPEIASGNTSGGFGPVVWEKEAVLLPSGLRLFYRNLRFDQDQGGWLFEYGRKTKRLFGGKLMENIVQALARIIVMDAALRINKRLKKLGLELAMQVHDELVYVAPVEFTSVVKQILREEMNVAPVWMPNLPLACEVESGPNYGEAK